ncbi:MAG: flagellar hook-basal body complex protein FliE [Pseudomonadales bacterium]|nr:flagellar hook-basal body complex protein FliE [Pseudomonadales bacterium]NRA18034.1 flagellar hook-basal body complex protein FliE [Oceanospirillaceae bacterium]
MIERADINSVLMQMRSIKSQAQEQIPSVNFSAKDSKIQEIQKSDFGQLLKSAVDKVNETQAISKNLATAYEKGDPTVELTQVMVSLQKSSIAFEAMAQVRNKLVSAYEDVMKMPI